MHALTHAWIHICVQRARSESDSVWVIPAVKQSWMLSSTLIHLFRPKSLTSHAANVFFDLKFQWNPSEFLFPGTHHDCWDEAMFSLSLSSFLPRPSCESEMKSLAFPVSPPPEVPARKICGFSIVIIYSLSFSGLLSCLKTGTFGLKTYISSSKTELDSDEGGSTPVLDKGVSCESEKDINQMSSFQRQDEDEDQSHVEVQ